LERQAEFPVCRFFISLKIQNSERYF